MKHYKPKQCERCGEVYVPKGSKSNYCYNDDCRKDREYEHNKELYQRQLELHPDHHKEEYQRTLELHPDHIKEQYQRALELHPDYLKEQYQRALELHPDRNKEHHEKYPEAFRAANHRRRARKRGNGGDHSPQDERDLIAAQEHLCFYCNNPLFETLDPNNKHIEHVVGLANGGANAPYNLVYSCQKCNSTKLRLADCADALLMDLIKNGTLNGSEAFHKSSTLKQAREYQVNPIVFRAKLRAESMMRI
jgi:hypothetical protein